MHIHPDLVFFGILLALIFAISARIVYSRAKEKVISHRWTESIMHLGQISLALGVLLQLIELSTALEHTTNSLTTEEIANGLRSTLFSTMHGLLVYLIAMVLFVILRLTKKKESG